MYPKPIETKDYKMLFQIFCHQEIQNFYDIEMEDVSVGEQLEVLKKERGYLFDDLRDAAWSDIATEQMGH